MAFTDYVWAPQPRAFELWLPKKLAPPEWKWEETPANQLTLRRGQAVMVGVPLCYAIYMVGSWIAPGSTWNLAAFAMSLIYVFSAIADMVDGRLAHYTGTESFCGRYLDPIMDKLSVTATYPVLLTYYKPAAWMITIPLFLAYDLGMLFLRRIDAGFRTHWVAKIKQFILFLGTGSLVVNVYAADKAGLGDSTWAVIHSYAVVIGPRALYVAAVLTILAALMYLFSLLKRRLQR